MIVDIMKVIPMNLTDKIRNYASITVLTTSLLGCGGVSHDTGIKVEHSLPADCKKLIDIDYGHGGLGITYETPEGKIIFKNYNIGLDGNSLECIRTYTFTPQQGK